MINYRIILRILGGLLFQEAITMLICMVVALYFQEDDILLFSTSAVLTILAGVVMQFFGRNADNRLTRRDACLLVTLIWVVYSLFATLPFSLGRLSAQFYRCLF